VAEEVEKMHQIDIFGTKRGQNLSYGPGGVGEMIFVHIIGAENYLESLDMIGSLVLSKTSMDTPRFDQYAR
jgi:hypothetical protein